MPDSQAHLPPGNLRQRLLQTSKQALPADYVAVLRLFCEESPEIEAGYVCAAATTSQGQQQQTSLRFAVKLSWPVTKPEDIRDASTELAIRLAGKHRRVLQDLGLAVLAEGAIPAWERYGVRIFPG